MFKIGDKVVCVESTKNITYGKVYIVLDRNRWAGATVIEIVDDVDEKAWYYAPRFTSAIITNPDPLGSPLVTIPESEYHSLIEEVNMLQELVAELSSPQDTAQEQQAETYRELQKLLTNHHSFQRAGYEENTTHLEELVNTVMELQAAWDRLASTPKKDVTDTTGFKPISEYTLADWEQAKCEGGVFEQNSGSLVKIGETNYDKCYPIELLSADDLPNHKGIVMLNGCYWEYEPEDEDSIKRRVK